MKSTYLLSVILLLWAGLLQAQTATDSVAYFEVSFLQKGKQISPDEDHEVKLKKDDFVIVLTMNNPWKVSVNASFKSAYFKLAEEGAPLNDFICFRKGHGMAESPFNEARHLFVADTLKNFWFYSNAELHRFDSVEVVSNTVVRAHRTIKYFYMNDGTAYAPFMVREVPKGKLFLVFMMQNDKGELKREYVKVKF